MSFVHFLIETPVVALLLLLALLLTVVPIVAGLLSRRKTTRSDPTGSPPQELPATRFLGTQMDLAILIFGLLLLLALAAWVYETFFQ
jgi:uncharacterized SAM-binding protein YcdF (DUF218 family)